MKLSKVNQYAARLNEIEILFDDQRLLPWEFNNLLAEVREIRVDLQRDIMRNRMKLHDIRVIQGGAK